MNRRISRTHSGSKETHRHERLVPLFHRCLSTQSRMVAHGNRSREEFLHITKPFSIRIQTESDRLPFTGRFCYCRRQIMMHQGLCRGYDIRITEHAVQLRLQKIGSQSDSFATHLIRRSHQRHLLHEHTVAIRRKEQRIQHHIAAYLIRFGTIHIYRQRKRCAEERRAILGKRREVKMAATQVEVYLRIFIAQIHYSVE